MHSEIKNLVETFNNGWTQGKLDKTASCLHNDVILGLTLFFGKLLAYMRNSILLSHYSSSNRLIYNRLRLSF